MESGQEYRYKNFTTKLLFRDLRFNKNAPKAGENIPDFILTTTAGDQVKKDDFVGTKPLLLIFGSLTCPMTASAMPIIKRLHGKFGDKVAFVLLNVREAHPGEHVPQPENMETKLENARKLKDLYGIDWTVATDNIDGTLHRALDPKPNAAFLMNTRGTIIFRSLWASDGAALTQALDDLVSGKLPRNAQSQKMLLPVARAMGHVQEVMQRGGLRAVRDLWLAGFPMALAGRLATLFQPLSPNLRGVVSVSTLGITMIVVIAFVLWWLLQ